ncbi:hypothetical protein BSF42_38070 [Flavobacterium sp. ACN6]|nr:hypothetical protein BSF42_38070 [Flavobacterium sp. ACN6]
MTSTVNGVSSVVDLTTAVADVTTNDLENTVNTITSTVNGVSKTAPAVNTVENTLTGKNLTTTVNGVAGTPIDLTPALADATTNDLTLSGKDLTSTVNGVSSVVDLTTAVADVTTNDLSLSGKDLTSTVNGVSSVVDLTTAVADVTTNDLTLSGKDLTSTVNGVSSVVDLTTAVADVTTNDLTSTGNILTSNVNGISRTANVVNTNALTLSGSNLTSTINGFASTAVDLSGLTGWGLAGNAGTATSFLGTTNNQPLRFRSNNTERMTITANGFVGIGNTAPNAPLQFSNTNVPRKIVLWEDRNNDFEFYGFGISPAMFRSNISSNGASFGWFAAASATSSNELMRLTGSGNLGIKVTNPTSTLHVQGTARIDGLTAAATPDSTDEIVVVDGSAAAATKGNLKRVPLSSILPATTNDLTSSGNVLTSDVNGISRTANVINTNALTLTGSNLTSTINGVSSNVANLSGLTGWGLTGNAVTATDFIGSTNNLPLRFRTNNTEKMIIAADGRVGIGTGTAAVTYALDVKSPTSDEYLARFMPGNGTEGVAIGWTGIRKIGNTANSNFKISPQGTGRIILDGPVTANGFVGIGMTAPNAPLQFSNSVAHRKIVLYDQANNDFQFYGLGISSGMFRSNVNSTTSNFGWFSGTSVTSSNELMRLTGSGNLGIKVTNPTSTLHVQGTARIDGLTAVTALDSTDQIVLVDGSAAAATKGNLKRVPLSSILAATTNDLSSIGNVMTSNVNGVSRTANMVNTNVLTLTGTNLTSTINGVTSNLANLSGLAGWGLAGNAGTTTSFLGTTNNTPLRFRANNSEKMIIGADGKVGIGTGTDVLTHSLNVVSTANDEFLAKFLPLNQWEGVAIGWTGMSKIGGAPNSNFKISPKGTGVINLDGHVFIKTLPTGAAADGIVTTDASGNLRKRALADILPPVVPTTNDLTSTGNIMTSNVNGISRTANVVNTNALTLTGSNLTSTINGFASTAIDLSGLTGWGLTGNTGTATSFLGTTNNQPLRFRSNNTERMTITANGFVGIGMTAPNAPLQFSNSVAHRKIVLYDQANNDFQFYGLGISSGMFRSNITSGASFGWFAATSATSSNELMRLTGSGNLGIKVTNPTSTLHVQGTARIDGLTAAAAPDSTDQIVVVDGSAAAATKGNLKRVPLSSILPATTNDLTSSGNVLTSNVNGISRTANVVNTNALTLTGTNLTSTINGVSSNVANLSGLTGWGLTGNAVTATNFIGSTNNLPLRFRTNNTEKMIIAADGRVGIGTGTAAITYALDVKSPTSDEYLARFMPGNGTEGVAIGWTGISKIGNTANSNFKISPQGTGLINLDGPVYIKTLPTGTPADAVITTDAYGNLRKRTLTTTNVLSSTANVMTSNVNGISSTANILNTNALTLTGTNLTSTINGFSSNVADLSGLTGWGLSGNTVTAANFIGSTNNQALRFRTNNTEKMVITADGRFAIGTGISTSIYALDVQSPTNDQNLASFLPANRSEGFAIGWSEIRKTGNNANSNFRISPKGTGVIDLNGRVLVRNIPNGSVTDTDLTTDASGNITKVTRRFTADAGQAVTNVTTAGINTVTIKSSTAVWNAEKIQGRAVSSTAPTTGQFLQYNGRGEWAPSTLGTAAPVVMANLGAGVDLPPVPAGTVNWRYTGTSITIPANSSYIITVKIKAVPDSTINGSFTWIKSAFSTSNVTYAPPSGIVGSPLISGDVTGPAKASMISGSVIMRNAAPYDQTLYYFAGAEDHYGTFATIKNFGANNTIAAENLIYAVPIN